jgi:hypothetical protein
LYHQLFFVLAHLQSKRQQGDDFLCCCDWDTADGFCCCFLRVDISRIRFVNTWMAFDKMIDFGFMSECAIENSRWLPLIGFYFLVCHFLIDTFPKKGSAIKMIIPA